MTEWRQAESPPAGAPVTGTFAGELYYELGPVAQNDEEHGWALARYLSAIGAMFEDVETLIRDQDGRPGWAILFDPDACPAYALPWLAQVAGVPASARQDEASLRAAIRDRAGTRRGTPAALAAAAAATLTGARSVRLFEREAGDAYAIGIKVRPSETPDDAVTLAAAKAAKPAGVLLTLYVADYALYVELPDDYDDYDDLLATAPANYGLLAEA